MSAVAEFKAGVGRALGAGYLSRRYLILFYTLLLTLVASPLVVNSSDSPPGRNSAATMVASVAGFGVRSRRGSPPWLSISRRSEVVGAL